MDQPEQAVPATPANEVPVTPKAEQHCSFCSHPTAFLHFSDKVANHTFSLCIHCTEKGIRNLVK